MNLPEIFNNMFNKAINGIINFLKDLTENRKNVELDINTKDDEFSKKVNDMNSTLDKAKKAIKPLEEINPLEVKSLDYNINNSLIEEVRESNT